MMGSGGVGTVVAGAGRRWFWLWRRSWSASRKWRRKSDKGFLGVGFGPRHSRQATSNMTCRVDKMLYPMRMTEAALGASLPAVANRMPTFSLCE